MRSSQLLRDQPRAHPRPVPMTLVRAAPSSGRSAAPSTGQSPASVTVAIIDPHPVTGRGIATLLHEAAIYPPAHSTSHGNTIEGTTIEGRTSAGSALVVDACVTRLDSIELVGPGRPDIAVIDTTLSDGADPLASVTALIAAGVRVVLFTQDRRPGVLWRCVRAGVSGIVAKTADRELLTAVRAVAAGGTHLHAPDLRALAASSGWAAPDLPPREREALVLLCEGLPLKTMARRMGVSQSTVREFLTRTRARYACAGRPAATRTELLRRAVEDGIVPPHAWLSSES